MSLSNATRSPLFQASKRLVTSVGLLGSLMLFERERYQRIVHTCARRNDNELLSGACAIRHRHGCVLVWNIAAPDLFACLLVERVEIFVTAADEHLAALRDHRAATINISTRSTRR